MSQPQPKAEVFETIDSTTKIYRMNSGTIVSMEAGGVLVENNDAILHGSD